MDSAYLPDFNGVASLLNFFKKLIKPHMPSLYRDTTGVKVNYMENYFISVVLDLDGSQASLATLLML